MTSMHLWILAGLRSELNFSIDSFKMSAMGVRVKIFPRCDEMGNFNSNCLKKKKNWKKTEKKQ